MKWNETRPELRALNCLEPGVNFLYSADIDDESVGWGWKG